MVNDWSHHIYQMAKYGGNDTGSFAGAMVYAYSKADGDNRRQIAKAFPLLAQEWAVAFESHAKSRKARIFVVYKSVATGS